MMQEAAATEWILDIGNSEVPIAAWQPALVGRGAQHVQ